MVQEGIIQEIFSEMEQTLISRGYSFETNSILFISLNKVRQELIEEIRKIGLPFTEDSNVPWAIKAIIGDSKE